MRIVALDPAIINCVRPADAEAAEWYLEAVPTGVFPSVRLQDEEVPAGTGIAFREVWSGTAG